MREQLFTLAELEVQNGEKGGSPLESYVMGTLPADLRAVSEGTCSHEELAAGQAVLLEKVAPDISKNTDTYTAQVTQLDLLFMLSAHSPSGDAYGSAPPLLADLLRQQQERFFLQPHMSYEMVIDLNSEEFIRTGNMRVFSDGEGALHERDFYYGHFLAEPYIRDAAYGLRSLADDAASPDQLLSYLECVKTNLVEFKRYMASYSRLPAEAFTYFRQFLSGYNDSAPGASGAFMPSVQLLELTMLPPTPMYDTYLDTSMPHFPGHARPTISEWREASANGINLKERIEASALKLGEAEHQALLKVVDEFIHFRMLHLGITRTHLPHVFDGNEGLTRNHISSQEGEGQIFDKKTEGTGGFDIRNVLANGVYRLLKFRDQLDAEDSKPNIKGDI